VLKLTIQIMRLLGCGDSSMKELIRNGGFERDALDFWEVYLGTGEVVNTEKHTGYHSAKLTCGSMNTVYLYTGDYIEVSPYELYRVLTWHKNVSWTYLEGYVNFYDSDYQPVSDYDMRMFKKTGAYDWTRDEFFCAIPSDASYATLEYHAVGTSGTYGYIDSVSLSQLNVANIAAMHTTLVEEENLTTSGTYYSDNFFSGIWKQAIFALNCTSLTGSSPTLDVTIEGYLPDVDMWVDITSFTQLTSAGSEVKIIGNLVGWLLRVKYVLGGTVTDCDFKVGVVYKR